MFIYCIKPNDKINCDFVKIGYCSNIESIKKRYTTPYGSNFICYFINIDTIQGEKIIHNRLKYLKLHLENELFLYNKEYNFHFYINELTKLELDFKDKLEDHILMNRLNTDLNKKIHIYDFLIFFLNKFIPIYKKKYDKIESNYYKIYYKKYKYNNELNINFLYSEYLLFCYKLSNQICNSKNKLKEKIMLIECNNFIHYRSNYFMITNNIIIMKTNIKISLKEYIKNIYNIEMDEKMCLKFEKYIITKKIDILLDTNYFHDKIFKILEKDNIIITYNILIKIENHIGLKDFIKIRYNIIHNEDIENRYYNLINYGSIMDFINFINIDTLCIILKDHNMEILRNTSGKIIYILNMYKKNMFNKSCYMNNNYKLYILWKVFRNTPRGVICQDIKILEK